MLKPVVKYNSCQPPSIQYDLPVLTTRTNLCWPCEGHTVCHEEQDHLQWTRGSGGGCIPKCMNEWQEPLTAAVSVNWISIAHGEHVQLHAGQWLWQKERHVQTCQGRGSEPTKGNQLTTFANYANVKVWGLCIETLFATQLKTQNCKWWCLQTHPGFHTCPLWPIHPKCTTWVIHC